MKTGCRTLTELDTAWMRHAACAQIPGLPWTDDGRAPKCLVELMAQTCACCPVLEDCRAFVVEADVTGGWWAGANRNDRHSGPQSSTDAA